MVDTAACPAGCSKRIYNDHFSHFSLSQVLRRVLTLMLCCVNTSRVIFTEKRSLDIFRFYGGRVEVYSVLGDSIYEMLAMMRNSPTGLPPYSFSFFLKWHGIY